MLRIDHHGFPVVAKVRHRVGDHIECFGGGGTQCFNDVPRRRLGYQADKLGTRPDQVGHNRVRLRPAACFPGGAEGDEVGSGQG